MVDRYRAPATLPAEEQKPLSRMASLVTSVMETEQAGGGGAGGGGEGGGGEGGGGEGGGREGGKGEGGGGRGGDGRGGSGEGGGGSGGGGLGGGGEGGGGDGGGGYGGGGSGGVGGEGLGGRGGGKGDGGGGRHGALCISVSGVHGLETDRMLPHPRLKTLNVNEANSEVSKVLYICCTSAGPCSCATTTMLVAL